MFWPEGLHHMYCFKPEGLHHMYCFRPEGLHHMYCFRPEGLHHMYCFRLRMKTSVRFSARFCTKFGSHFLILSFSQTRCCLGNCYRNRK